MEPKLASESDPAAHPLYGLVCWLLERQLTPLDGGQFFDRWRQLALAAIDTALDELLAMED